MHKNVRLPIAYHVIGHPVYSRCMYGLLIGCKCLSFAFYVTCMVIPNYGTNQLGVSIKYTLPYFIETGQISMEFSLSE